MTIVDHLSPNCGERRGGARPAMVVLHYTGMETTEAAVALLCDPASEVSAHYVISETGAVVRLVPEEMRAWHAGAGSWGGLGDVNSRSIGIELANTARHAFPEPQMRALEASAGRDHGALGRRPGSGDRAFRHGARAQGRSGPEVRLAPAGACRGCRSGPRGTSAMSRGSARMRWPSAILMCRTRCCCRRCGCGSGPGLWGRSMRWMRGSWRGWRGAGRRCGARAVRSEGAKGAQ